jgi:ribonuclease HIII
MHSFTKSEIEDFVIKINEHLFNRLLKDIEDDYFHSNNSSFCVFIRKNNIRIYYYKISQYLNKEKLNYLLKSVDSEVKLSEDLCHIINF